MTHARDADRRRSLPAELPDVLQFLRVMWSVVHALQKASKRMNSTLKVTGPQRLVLRIVGCFPGISAGELAEILHVHPSTLTGVLQRVVSQRLLRRTRDPRDRRRLVLDLTPTGARLNALNRGTVEAIVRAALQHVDDGDRAATQRVLTLVADRLARGNK